MSKKKTNARSLGSLIIIAAVMASMLIPGCQKQTAASPAGEEKPSEAAYIDLFDYTGILIKNTSSIGTKIKNCNVYLDIYGDLVFFGELENTSDTAKTDIEITIDFLNSNNGAVHSAIIKIPINYLRSGARYPFHYYFTEKEKYIDIFSIKTGVNYRQYQKNLEGNPIAEAENYFYEDDYLIIEGSVINLGKEKIKNIRLLCTFYDKRDRVVFIKETHLAREKMMPSEDQKFQLKILLDQYLKEFTHYSFEVFFEDEIKVPA